jgi:hypothetical protein
VSSLPHPCPACGFAVFAKPPGSDVTCPVCGWVDDFVQLVQPDFSVGPNGISLREAQRQAAGRVPAGAGAFRGYSRHPAWRPLAPGEYPEKGSSCSASPVCYLTTPDQDEFEPYWSSAPRSDS